MFDADAANISHIFSVKVIARSLPFRIFEIYFNAGTTSIGMLCYVMEYNMNLLWRRRKIYIKIIFLFCMAVPFIVHFAFSLILENLHISNTHSVIHGMSCVKYIVKSLIVIYLKWEFTHWNFVIKYTIWIHFTLLN